MLNEMSMQGIDKNLEIWTCRAASCLPEGEYPFDLRVMPPTVLGNWPKDYKLIHQKANGTKCLPV